MLKLTKKRISKFKTEFYESKKSPKNAWLNFATVVNV